MPAIKNAQLLRSGYELTILLTAFATLGGMLGLNRLPQLYHWAFHSKRFHRVTDDRFFITIDAEDPKFNLDLTRGLLDKTHPLSVETVSEVVDAHDTKLRENMGTTIEAPAGISSPLAKTKGH